MKKPQNPDPAPPKQPKRKTRRRKDRGAAHIGGVHDLWRFGFVWVFMALALVVLLARAYRVQVVNQDFYRAKGEEFMLSKRTLPVTRAPIVDTNGLTLAANAPLVTVSFNPYEYAQAYYDALRARQTAKDDEARQKADEKLNGMDLAILARASGYDLDKLTQSVALKSDVDLTDKKAIEDALPKGKGSRYVVLQKEVDPKKAQALLALNFAGVEKHTLSKRFYLQAEPMAQILGYMGYATVTDADGKQKSVYNGRSGLERQYDNALQGSAGQTLVLQDSRRKILKQIEQIKPAQDGQEIALTIDSRVQYLLYKELESAGREQSARWTSGIVANVRTGDIVAMASWPSFNTNNLNEREGANERNRPLLDVFEPGSTMKPFTVVAALESGKYNTRTAIDTGNGTMRLGGGVIRDAKAYGSITLAQLIQKSSNVASGKIALSLPSDAIANTQRRFGFGQKTGLNFPAEAAGGVPTPKDFEKARRVTLSYGYGQTVTLAQIAQAYATLGAKGVRHPLRLVKNEAKAPSVQVVDAKIADEVVKMMELVTLQGGTAPQAAIDGYRVAGKTGTARRTSPEGGYAKDEHRVLFAGLAPASDPLFVAVILVEDPREQRGSGAVAGAPFSRVMGEVLRLYNAPMDKPLE